MHEQPIIGVTRARINQGLNKPNGSSLCDLVSMVPSL